MHKVIASDAYFGWRWNVRVLFKINCWNVMQRRNGLSFMGEVGGQSGMGCKAKDTAQVDLFPWCVWWMGAKGGGGGLVERACGGGLIVCGMVLSL
jgi:hypothetical protein